MVLETLYHLRSWLMMVPRNLCVSALLTAEPFISKGRCGGCFLLKPIIISTVYASSTLSCTPAIRLDFCPICELIFVWYESHKGGVICELDGLDGVTFRSTVLGVQWVEQGRNHATLWSTSVELERVWELIIHSHVLFQDRKSIIQQQAGGGMLSSLSSSNWRSEMMLLNMPRFVTRPMLVHSLHTDPMADS